VLYKKMFLLAAGLLAGLVLQVANSSAQTVAYRQTNLASDINTPGFANHLNAALRNSWGIAVETGPSFFIANADGGRVTAHDATGASVRPGAFSVANLAAADAPGNPTGIAADPNAAFGAADPAHLLTSVAIVATEDGGIFLWGVDSAGDIPQQATLMVDNSSVGAVYTSLAILSPTCCASVLAVANFHSGRVETYDTHFAPLGTFQDPNLPPGYAPYGMQVIGSQLFVTWALQDAAKHDPVVGAGNGIVSIFDLNGRFVRRFQTGGPLNAPWGIAQASANFGPFSGDILIGNVGDGTITAFDPATGNAVDQIKDGDGEVIANEGLHALLFQTPGSADPDTLFFTAGINGGQDGILGALTAAPASTTSVSVPPPSPDGSVAITVTVSAAPGNSGAPTGQVVITDGGAVISSLTLNDGEVTFHASLTGAGTHTIQAQYSGDQNFLPSSSQTEVQVTGFGTMLTLNVPANATPGAAVTLTATVSSPDGIPTGQIAFHDGSLNLGSADLDDSGIAVLRVNTLSIGAHSLTASYAGDQKFAGSTSAPATINILSPDFSLTAAPATATVISGQAAQFLLTIAPEGGFTGSVAFSCQSTAGVTCAFNPEALNLGQNSASTTLTITASATPASRFSLFPVADPIFLLVAIFLFLFVFWRGTKLTSMRPAFLTSAAALTLVALSLTFLGCGGSASPAPANTDIVSILVTAKSASATHQAMISVTVR